MPRLVLVPLLCLSCLWGCAALHAVTRDPMFAPEPKPEIKGPNVPEPEPSDDRFEAELDEAKHPPPPSAPVKKSATRVAARKQAP